MRVAFLRSFTVEPLVPILRSAGLVAGIDATVHVGEFNSYAQEILNSNSGLYRFNPEVVFLAIQTRDIAPELWDGFADLSEGDAQTAVDRVLQSYSGWVRKFRENTKASLVIHNLEKPVASMGVLESQRKFGQLSAIERINTGLREICGEHRGVYLLDYDAVVAQHGRVRWHDEGKWLMMRMPFAPDSMLPMVNEWLKFLHPLTGATCKVLVLDLDNTLWGGILGEDGFDGIKLGTEYPGAMYRSFQRAILDLYDRGILLAVCSKNNPQEAMDALEKHPGMLLRPEHFAAFRINWQDKATNLREIAAELNLSVDSMAFFDDNPVERELIRSEVPEVKVIAVPDHVQGYVQALRGCAYFERLTLSAEDQEKTKQYQEQRKRSELQRTLVHSRISSVSGAGTGDRESQWRIDRPCGAAHAEDQPVQRDHATLHRAADCGFCVESGIWRLCNSREGPLRRQRHRWSAHYAARARTSAKSIHFC